MKKTKKTFRLGALLLIVCLISTVMLSGTFAKYTSEYAGQDTALVARWSFTATGGDGDIALGTSAAPAELYLFDHLYATHINQSATDGKFIIAPGVGDEFTVKMNYIADVDADVLITIDPLDDNALVPIEYSVDGGSNWVTLDALPEALSERIKFTNVDTAISASVPDDVGSFRIAKVGTGSVNDINISETVKWRWAYNTAAQAAGFAIASDDITDTALGVASQTAAATDITKRTTYGIKINLKATQVVPVAATPAAITGIGAINGTPKVGLPLTPGALTPVGATASYQWQICNTADGSYTNISGATSNTYTPVPDDATKFIKVAATGTNGFTGTVTSAATAAVAAP